MAGNPKFEAPPCAPARRKRRRLDSRTLVGTRPAFVFRAPRWAPSGLESYGLGLQMGAEPTLHGGEPSFAKVTIPETLYFKVLSCCQNDFCGCGFAALCMCLSVWLLLVRKPCPWPQKQVFATTPGFGKAVSLSTTSAKDTLEDCTSMGSLPFAQDVCKWSTCLHLERGPDPRHAIVRYLAPACSARQLPTPDLSTLPGCFSAKAEARGASRMCAWLGQLVFLRWL